MQAGKRYSFFGALNWGRKYILTFIIFDALVTIGYAKLNLKFLAIPWEPIGLIGIAVAFYLGFKNNSSYERLWEARKIWGGIVNVSRSFTVMTREFLNNDESIQPAEDAKLSSLRRTIVNRHIAWLRTMTIELRKVKAWEHDTKADKKLRQHFGVVYDEKRFEEVRPYLSNEEFNYVMTKGNRSSHLLSLQTKQLMQLRREGLFEHFRHLELQKLVTEMYTLQGKSERIKNFPFPRQYASVNYFFAVLFIFLLPFAMLSTFQTLDDCLIWLSIPFSVIGSWVFWTMEMIGDYSENPFEGLYNDVPISSMTIGIERDILQMLEETDLPEPLQPSTSHNIVV